MKPTARDALADRFGAGDASPLAHIRGPQHAVALVIPHRHPIAAAPAHHEPLQECPALTRRAPASVAPDRSGIFQQPALIVFKLLLDGNATARLYIDEDANADQRRELEAICSGQRGGPMATIAPLIAKWLPARSAKIDVADKGDAITSRSATQAG
jgi:Protein of unknown function (DUF1326)